MKTSSLRAMYVALLVGLLCFTTNGNAADIYLSEEYGGQIDEAGIPAHIVKHLVISGAIEEGDFKKLIALVKPAPEQFYIALHSVYLDSEGGDIREAMKIAEILKPLYPVISVKPQGYCTSSCLLLWLSGATRSAQNGSIGIHRPYFNPAYFRSLSMHDAEKQYVAMSDEFRAFVLQQGLPQSLYEKLIATPSASVYWLTTQDIRLIGSSPPYYQERLLASCGGFLGDNLKPREFLICSSRMVKPDRFHGIDRILGDKKDEGWEYFKKEMLSR